MRINKPTFPGETDDCSQTGDLGGTDFYNLICAVNHGLFCIWFNNISEGRGGKNMQSNDPFSRISSTICPTV